MYVEMFMARDKKLLVFFGVRSVIKRENQKINIDCYEFYEPNSRNDRKYCHLKGGNIFIKSNRDILLSLNMTSKSLLRGDLQNR